jgi:uncharacterized coiled-coil protein SlyX
MISLYRDPLGEKVFSKSGLTNHSSNRSVTGAAGDQTIASLQNRVKELELALSKHTLDTEKYDVELDSMTDSMKTSQPKTVSFNQ